MAEKLRWLSDPKRVSGGRWTKEYRKRKFYFAEVKGKSDREGYAKALEAFKLWRAKIDTELAAEEAAEKPEAAFAIESAIQYRRDLIEWFRLEGIEESDPQGRHLSRWQKELLILQNELRKANPTHPVFLGIAELPWGSIVADADEEHQKALITSQYNQRVAEVRAHKRFTSTAKPRQTIEVLHKKYIEGEYQRVTTSEITPATLKATQQRLAHFIEFSADLDPTQFDEFQVDEFKSHLSQQIASGRFSQQFANDICVAAKRFIGWLYERRMIAELPRNLKRLNFGRVEREIQTMPLDTLKTLLDNATPKTKLYLLLQINCGFRSKDIAQLRRSEWNPRLNTITRKRGKTRKKSDKVPLVTWRLWDETAKLLKGFQSKSGDLLLLNEDGLPLIREPVNEKTLKVSKINNVTTAYKRLTARLKIKNAPEALLRATSATLLNKKYSAFVAYFLGHAPQGVTQVHYAKPPQDAFDEAVKWLGEQYGFSTS